MEGASEFTPQGSHVQVDQESPLVKALDDLKQDPLRTPFPLNNPRVASVIVRSNDPRAQEVLVRKIVDPLYMPDQLAEMSETVVGGRLILERDAKGDYISTIIGAGDGSSRNQTIDTVRKIREGLKGGAASEDQVTKEMDRHLLEELENELPLEFNDLLAESIQTNGIHTGVKLSVLQSFKELYQQDAQNKARQAEGLYPEKIQRIDPRLVTEKFNLVFSNDPIYGQLREVLFDHAEHDGQTRINNMVKVIVTDEIRKAQEAGQEMQDGDLATEALRYFQVARDGVVNPDNVKYLLDLTHDMTQETPSKPSDLAYMAAKVFLNETQDMELGDQAMEIALRSVEMVFSENTDDYQELENNGTDKGKLLVFVESFFKKRRHAIASSVQNADLTSIDKLFTAFTAYKDAKMNEQREKLVGMLKTEAVQHPGEIQIQEREGYPDSIEKAKKGMLHDLLPVEMLSARLMPIISAFG